MKTATQTRLSVNRAMKDGAKPEKSKFDDLWNEEIKALHAIEAWGATLFLSSIALITKQLIDWTTAIQTAGMPPSQWQLFLLPALVGMVAFSFLRIVNFRIRQVRAGQYAGAGVESVGSLSSGSFGLVGWSMAAMPLGFGLLVSWFLGINRKEMAAAFWPMAGVAVSMAGIAFAFFIWQNREIAKRRSPERAARGDHESTTMAPESEMEMAVRICGPKTGIFSGGEIQLFATAEQFNELVREIVEKHAGRTSATDSGDFADPADNEVRALEWIKSTIADKLQNGDRGYVEHEVVEEFNKYRKNQPKGSALDHAKSAMHACAHQ